MSEKQNCPTLHLHCPALDAARAAIDRLNGEHKAACAKCRYDGGAQAKLACTIAAGQVMLIALAEEAVSFGLPQSPRIKSAIAAWNAAIKEGEI